MMLLVCLPVCAAWSADITVYTEYYGRSNHRAENGEIVGETADLVRQVLDDAALNYTIKLVPWNRAYQLATHFDNTLIYALLRKPDREEKFHWLVPISETELYLYARADDDRVFDRTSLSAGQIRGVCQLGDVTCSMLSDLGMPQSMIIKVKENHAEATRVMMAGRADVFIAQHLHGYPFEDDGDGRKGQFKVVLKLEQTQQFFLAAGMQVDPAVVRAVRSAHARLKAGDKLLWQP